MKLELFTFIDETISYFDVNQPTYQYVEGKLCELYRHLLNQNATKVVSLHSRIKTRESLKEKLIRNRFYLDYPDPEVAIDHLSDLIGITLQCRFIRNEHELYESLFTCFETNEEEYAQCIHDPNVYLNLHMPQPQTQRNGFTIYRLDGYYQFNDKKVNYELQIKSLVHNFWSDIEHEVVYKNPDFVMYDTFNKAMLGAIRDNLDVVDRQLEIMYNEISYESSRAQIGMDERGFKIFVSQSINELVNRKMKDSVGFATDFKKCSAMIAQYIYIRDFISGEHNQERMIDYLSLLNYLHESEIDFSNVIELETEFHSDDPFIQKIGDYWLSQMNANFQWHVFFAMLFQIQPGNNSEDFLDFCSVIRMLVVQPSWFRNQFNSFGEENQRIAHELFEGALADALITIGKIEIVHEDRLYECMNTFKRLVEEAQDQYESLTEILDNQDQIVQNMRYHICKIFS